MSQLSSLLKKGSYYGSIEEHFTESFHSLLELKRESGRLVDERKILKNDLRFLRKIFLMFANKWKAPCGNNIGL